MDDNIILQADATVITGLLILLTVAYNLTPRSPESALATVRSLSQIIIGVVIPFSIFAILVILASVLGSYNIIIGLDTFTIASYTITLTNLGKYAMIFGFGLLAIGISWLLLSKATKSFECIQRGKDKTGDH